MRWKNTETPTYAGSDGTGITGPDVTETLDLVDRNETVIATFSKNVNGNLTFNVEGDTSNGLIAYKTANTARNQDNAPNQVETATITGTILAQAELIVTANGMANSPKTVKFNVAHGDTVNTVATKARAALVADADVSAFFTISGATSAVILTAKTKAANDATMNVASDNDTCGGLTAAPTSANTTAGVAAVLQVETATVVGTIVTGVAQVETATVIEDVPGTLGAGDVAVTVTAAGMTNSPKTIQVAVAENDSQDIVAGKIRDALTADADIGHVTTGFFTVSGATNEVILTAKAIAADDATMNIAIADNTSSGITDDATSADTTAGVASGAGNAEVIITAVGMTGTSKTVNVAVAEGDNASTIAGKIRTALTTDADVGHVTTGFFTVSGATDQVILTAKTAAANDATMNISVDNGTCTGITQDLTSDNTTAGVLGTLQVETATILVATTVATQALITVTAAGMGNSPKAINVTVAAGDTAPTVAGKVRTALALDADVAAFFTVGGTGAVVSLTVLTDSTYDATLNIASDNDTCGGLTPAATSANTTLLIVDSDYSIDLLEGTYLIVGQIPVTTDAGGFKCDFAGGTAAATNFIVDYTAFDPAGAVLDAARASALSDAGCVIDEGSTGANKVEIKGSIEVSTPGSLAFQWGQKVVHANDTTALRGGWVEATRVGV